VRVGLKKGKGKTIPVTGRGGPQGCETSRLPHFLENINLLRLMFPFVDSTIIPDLMSNFHEIWCEGYAVEGNLTSVLSSFLLSVIATRQLCQLQR
jgi:hypothetical protein